jgi:predicted small secreted protein
LFHPRAVFYNFAGFSWGYPEMKRLLIFALCAAFALAAAGCNTMRGMGKDIERAGEGIQNATN